MLLYRFLLSIFAAAVLTKGDVAARLGRGKAESGPHVWLHGASNGELTSVRPILEPLVHQRSDLNWLITCNTQTACDMVTGWGLPRVSARLAPVDLSWVTKPMMQRWNVQAHIALESEIWPHRILTCPGPTLMLGARMSASTARSWGKLGDLPGRVLGKVAFVSAQEEESAERLQTLGLPKSAIGPVVDLKALYQPPSTPVPSELTQAFDRSKTWLAASTHEGEEAPILAAHKQALAQDPELRLILAPRHPRRAKEIAAHIEQHGLSYAQRSKDQPPTAQVYLADTMGEMAFWYQLAGRVFIGGSLTDRGGHTPYEPAAFGAALIHGPDMHNFDVSARRLATAEAAIEIDSADALCAALMGLQSKEQQIAAGMAARKALHSDTDANALCGLVLQHLPNLVLQHLPKV